MREKFAAPDHATPQALRRTSGVYLVNAPGVPFTTDTTAFQLGHSVEVAVSHYLRQLHGIPVEHQTLDAAMCVTEDLSLVISRFSGSKPGPNQVQSRRTRIA